MEHRTDEALIASKCFVKGLDSLVDQHVFLFEVTIFFLGKLIGLALVSKTFSVEKFGACFINSDSNVEINMRSVEFRIRKVNIASVEKVFSICASNSVNSLLVVSDGFFSIVIATSMVKCKALIVIIE
jgi:hypothetical protein